MKFIKPLKLFILFLSVHSGISNANNQIDVTPFYAKNYSNNFTNKYNISFDIEWTEKTVTSKGKMFGKVSNGKEVMKFKQSWIGVLMTGDVIFGDEKSSSTMLDLYDTKTKLLAYSIDLEDEETTKYEWKKLPKLMKSGHSLKTGKTKKTTQDGKLISTSEISYKLKAVNQGYEFCTIEQEIVLESKEKNITTECDVFDSKKNIVGHNIDIMVGNQYVLRAIGRVEIDRDQ